MHVCDGGFGVGGGGVDYVGGAAVGVDCGWGVVSERIDGGRLGAREWGMSTLFVHRKLEIAYAAVGAEDFAEMAFMDVLGQSLDDDLCVVSSFSCQTVGD